MEWLLLAALVVAAAAFVVLPGLVRGRVADLPPTRADQERELLAEERRVLLAELRDLDEDAAAGRISAEDRLAGRRALAPRLRALTEAMQSAGALPDRTRPTPEATS